MDYQKYGFNDVMLGKRDQLINMGVDPYPYVYDDPQLISSIAVNKENLDVDSSNNYVTLVGRIWARRDMGKSIFIDLRDNSGQIQLFISSKNLNDEHWNIISLLDLGDMIGIKGGLFYTKTEELSVKVKELTLLTKSVVPLPIGKEKDDEVFSRMSGSEERYKQPHIHWLLNKESRERILKRSEIISAVRRSMESEGFLEVSTPTIESVYGGAEARPFETQIWALGRKKAYLRISPELYLKRYVVAGFNKVFSICQNFRNEGIDLSHNPEFTMIEWYEVFTDYKRQMERFESLVSNMAVEACGTNKINYQGVELDFSPPWRRLTVVDAIKENLDIDVNEMNVEDLKKELIEREITFDDSITWGVAVVELFEETCEESLIQPTFIIDHPVDISPLTKNKRGDNRLVERFEPYIFGMEVGNAYSELTDPVEQLNRLDAQRDITREDDDEFDTHPVDSDFIRTIGYGMPPTGGVGLGIDRIIMLLTDAKSIRDIIPFPMTK